MSWQLTSFLIVGAVLIGGFAWYERSRPPSQVVALVAALAALAIAGRIAFAAFPNVKPTTDIVVFAGYALGPAPGFAVGALTGLVSNFWFGQGPWTPWQMVGWGLCGVMGAGLALGARNASRFTLAAVCGFAGIAYGLLLNFSLMATYGGDLSIQRFLALEARAIPFDLAHAIGNVVFALLAGPAMVRMLVRFRRRFEWRQPAVATAVLAALLLPAIIPGSARAASAGRAADWLESMQNADGGFGSSPGDPSGAAITGWAMLGLEAAGRNPLDVSRGSNTPVDFLRSHIAEMSSSGDLARTIVALEGAGVDPRSFAGQNLVEELRGRRGKDGSFEGWPGTTSYSVIALRTAGATGGMEQTLSWLNDVQNGDGGWGDEPGQPSNADVTASVMQAMPHTKAAERGLSYLRRHQHSNGGFALGGSGGVNSQSTGWAVQGMIAIGIDPAGMTSGGNSALDYLTAQQASNGHFRYSASSDQTPIWVTGEALVAAAGKALPISPPSREKKPATGTSTTGRAGSGAGGGSPTPAELLQRAHGAAAGGSGTPSGGTQALPPASSGGLPAVPGAKSGGGSPEGEAGKGGETPGVLASQPVTATGSAPSPWVPIGFGLAATALAIAVPWWLGRRYGW
jgi:energy-coupling factor transport system substrate-specific component